MPKFFVAAGHGSSDPGAVSNFGIEKNIAEAIVDQCFNLLTHQDKKGWEIAKVPHELKLADAVNYINRNGGFTSNFCMEVHLNSNVGTPGTGTETYYGKQSLAQAVHSEVVRVLGLPDRGVKEGMGFYFNNSTVPMSCLVETGFVNNGNDVKAVVARGGLALCKGILRAIGSSYKEPVIVQPTPTPAPIDQKLADLQAVKKIVERY